MVKRLTDNQEKWNKQVEEDYRKKNRKEINKKELIKEYQQAIEKKMQKNIDPKRSLVEEYKHLQKEYFKIDDDETIKKWKVLSKAYKVGKEIYGQDF